MDNATLQKIHATVQQQPTITLDELFSNNNITQDSGKLEVWEDLHRVLNQKIKIAEHQPLFINKQLFQNIIHQQMDCDKLPAIHAVIKNYKTTQVFTNELYQCFHDSNYLQLDKGDIYKIQALFPIYEAISNACQELPDRYQNKLTEALTKIATLGDWVPYAPNIDNVITHLTTHKPYDSKDISLFSDVSMQYLVDHCDPSSLNDIIVQNYVIHGNIDIDLYRDIADLGVVDTEALSKGLSVYSHNGNDANGVLQRLANLNIPSAELPKYEKIFTHYIHTEKRDIGSHINKIVVENFGYRFVGSIEEALLDNQHGFHQLPPGAQGKIIPLIERLDIASEIEYCVTMCKPPANNPYGLYRTDITPEDNTIQRPQYLTESVLGGLYDEKHIRHFDFDVGTKQEEIELHF